MVANELGVHRAPHSDGDPVQPVKMSEMPSARASVGPLSGSREGELRVAMATACLILAFVPPLVTSFLVWRYTVDVPILDQWSMVEDLRQHAAGEWGLLELVRSHNGHRILVSRLILVPLASETGWNVRVEVMLNLLAASALLLAVLAGVRPLSAGRSVYHPRLLLATAAATLAVFSLAQWENWLWGSQLQVYLAVLFSVAAMVTLSVSRLGWGSWALAVLLVLLASFSQAPGLVAWPVGLILLAVHPEVRGRRAAMLAGWAVAAACLLWFYAQDLPGDAGARGVSLDFLDDPGRALIFVLTILGAPVVSFTGSAWPPEVSWVAPVAGTALLGVSGRLAWALWRSRTARASELLFPLAAVVWVLGVASLIALGRAHLGLPSAMASRYVTLATPAWVVTVALGIRVATSGVEGVALPRAFGGGWALAAYLGLLASSLASTPYFPSRQALLEPARAALVAGGPEEMLARLHPEVQQVRDGRPALGELGLSVFRHSAATPRQAPPDALRSFDQRLVVRGAPMAVASASRFDLTIEVGNPGAEAWPAAQQSAHPVNLSYHWIPMDGGETILDGRRTPLPAPLAPGRSVVLRAEVETPAIGGSYVLRLSMVQEHVGWFDARGAQPLDLPITVGNEPAPPPGAR